MRNHGKPSLLIRLALLASLALGAIGAPALAQQMREVLGAGDIIRISAFRYPELTTEARLSEDGKVTVPMIGPVTLRGMTPMQAAQHIAERLKRGKYLLNPQIEVSVIEARSRQISVLGYVMRPGRYMLDGTTARLTDVIAMAGGLVPDAADTAIVRRSHGKKTESINVDLAAIIRGGDDSKDISVGRGDSVFVPKAPVVYVYGEVMRGGSYRLEPDMTVMQAISVAGGVTPRGSENRTKLRRRSADGKWKETDAEPLERLAPDDVVYVRESLF